MSRLRGYLYLFIPTIQVKIIFSFFKPSPIQLYTQSFSNENIPNVYYSNFKR